MRLGGWLVATLAGLALGSANAAGEPSEQRAFVRPDEAVSLMGPWQVGLGDDPRWADPGWDDSQWPRADLDDGSPSPAECAAPVVWYRRRVALSVKRSEPVDVAFGAGWSPGSYEIYVDGQRVGHFGEVAPVPQAGLGEPPTPIITLTPGRVSLVALRSWLDPVNREALEKGRFPDTPLVGSLSEVRVEVLRAHQQQVRDADHEAGVAAVLFLVAMFHLLTWLLRRDLSVFAWYALGLTLLASWHFSQFDASIDVSWVPHLAGSFLTRYSLSAIGFMVAVFLQFAWRFLGPAAVPRSWRALQVLASALGVVTLIPGQVGIGAASSSTRIAVLLVITLVGLGAIGRAALRGRRDAQIIFVGVGIFVVASFIQAFGTVDNVSGVSFMIFGEASMVLGMAVALSHQFTRSLDTLDARNAELVATNTAIQRFVPYSFLQLLERKTVLEFGRGDSTLLQMSVMFCDLRGFTSLAESLGPEATFQFINEYLAAMEPSILSNGGFVNQYLGDGIMSLFHTSSDSAVASAARMAEGLRELNRQRETRGEPPLRIGVGIHTGPLMLGIIGGKARLSPGVVGDPVNVAARIEGMTKMYGVTALVSHVTCAGLSDGGSRLRELDRVVAKGKREPIGIYEVLDADLPTLAELKRSTLAEFANGLALYRRGDFAQARKAFLACLDVCPADTPAKIFADRTARLAAEGAPPTWTGITVLDAK